MNHIPRPHEALLQLWTVYDRPRDYPLHFVARQSFVGPHGTVTMSEHLLVSEDLEAIRNQMMAWGLHCLTRAPEDEPHIVEVWL